MGFRIAVYGKGGIGKTTVSANLSFSLASAGYRVTQIGCDPKHDSTRLLTDRCPETVLEYCHRVPPSGRNLEDLLVIGSAGVVCVEAGGPEPGVGCAGKGILTMFQALERLGLEGTGSDIEVYDVLGDVVCGGFAVPMRPDHSDCIMIVTSGEPMSIYAANNILRGSLNHGGGRVIGMVVNRRGVPSESEMVSEFSRATCIPIIADIGRSKLMSEADRHRQTVCEYAPESVEAGLFRGLAEMISSSGKGPFHTPSPLTDEQLDSLFSDIRVDGTGEYVASGRRGSNEGCMVRARRIGKGPIGAVIESAQVSDIPTVIHGPGTCVHTLGMVATESRLSDDSSSRMCIGRVVGSGMDAEGCIFGAIGSLRERLTSIISEGHMEVIVITTCVSSMIGEDVASVARSVEAENPGSRIMIIDAGCMGSGGDGHMEVLESLSTLVESDIEKDRGLAIVVDDTFLEIGRGTNRRCIDNLFSMVGMRLAPGFLDGCSSSEIRMMGRASVAVLGDTGRDNLRLRAVLEERGLRFMESSLPRGFRQTMDWLYELGLRTGRTDIADRARKDVEVGYRDVLDHVMPTLSGKHVAIVPDGLTDIGWMEEALEDAGMIIDDVVLSETDLVIGGMHDGKGPRRMSIPHTTISHLASDMLLRRAANVMVADDTLSWRQWGGSDV